MGRAGGGAEKPVTMGKQSKYASDAVADSQSSDDVAFEATTPRSSAGQVVKLPRDAPWVVVGARAYVCDWPFPMVIMGVHYVDDQPAQILTYKDFQRANVTRVLDYAPDEIECIAFDDDRAVERFKYLSSPKALKQFADAGLDPRGLRQLKAHPSLTKQLSDRAGRCYDNVEQVVKSNPDRGFKAQFGYSIHTQQCGCCVQTESHAYVRAEVGAAPFDWYFEFTPDYDPEEPVKVVIDDPVITISVVRNLVALGSSGAFESIGHPASMYTQRSGGGITFDPPRRVTCGAHAMTSNELKGLPAPWQWTRQAVLVAMKAGVLKAMPTNKKLGEKITRVVVGVLKGKSIGACEKCSRVDVLVTTCCSHCAE